MLRDRSSSDSLGLLISCTLLGATEIWLTYQGSALDLFSNPIKLSKFENTTATTNANEIVATK
jgi:hypothetical protein